MTIPELIAEVIDKREGGLVFTHDDPDPPTFAGITIHTARKYFGPAFTVEQLKHLTRDEVEAIYLRMFVLDPKFHRITDDALRNVLVDFGINSGPAHAVTALQVALRFLGDDVDGQLGPKTIDAANTHPHPHELRNAVAVARALHCARLVQNDVNAFMKLFDAMKRKHPLIVREFFPRRRDELDVAVYNFGWIRRALDGVSMHGECS